MCPKKKTGASETLPPAEVRVRYCFFCCSWWCSYAACNGLPTKTYCASRRTNRTNTAEPSFLRSKHYTQKSIGFIRNCNRIDRSNRNTVEMAFPGNSAVLE